MAYNSGEWEGWVPCPSANGMVVNTHTHGHVHRSCIPRAAATTSSESSNTALIVGAVIAALAVIAIILLLVRRSRGRAVEE